MARKHEQQDAVEGAWKFEIGQSVEVSGKNGEVVWRRENANFERAYLVKTEDGEAWVAEADVA